MSGITQQRNLTYINLKDYCKIDGASDDSTGFTTAYTLASTLGMALWHPGGTLVKGNDTLLAGIPIMGVPGKSIIKLKNGANTDLFSANTANINLSGATGTGSATGTHYWGFYGIILDGNKANQSAGPSYLIRAYGYGHTLEHVEGRSGYSGGILLDWNNTANPTPPNNSLMPRWYDVSVHDCNGMLIEVGGPTDMQWIGVNGFNSGSHVVHIAPNAVFLRQTHCHFWGTPLGVSAVTLLNEAPGLMMTSCQIEGSDTCALVLLANDCQGVELDIGSTADVSRAGRGIQLGQQAGQTPYAGQIYQAAGVTTAATANICHLSGKFYACNAGALDERNTTGNAYALNAYQTSGTGIASNGGYPVSGNTGYLKVSGLTPDGSPGKGGFFQISNQSFNGLEVFGQTGDALFNLNTMSKGSGGGFNILNGYAMGMFTDNGSTYANDFANNANGQIYFGAAFDTYVQKNGAGVVQVGSAAQLGNNGSTLYSGSGAPSNANGANGDFYFRTDTPGTANQRIYAKSAGSWVGIV